MGAGALRSGAPQPTREEKVEVAAVLALWFRFARGLAMILWGRGLFRAGAAPWPVWRDPAACVLRL